MRAVQIGLEPHGLAVAHGGKLEPPGLASRVAKVHVKPHLLGAQRDGVFERFDGLARLAAHAQHDAEEVPRVGDLRVFCERLTAQPFAMQ